MIRKLGGLSLEGEKTVRNRCGFGCIICGTPLFTYHSIEEGEDPPMGRPDSMQVVLLCNKHQNELDRGDLSEDNVRMASRKPFTLRPNHTFKPPHALSFSGKTVEIEFGPIRQINGVHQFDTVISTVLVDEMGIFGTMVSQGHLLMNVLLFDEYNVKILHIRHNAILVIKDETNISFDDNLLQITYQGAVFLTLDCRVSGRIVVRSAKFLVNGLRIDLQDNTIFVNQKRIESKPRQIFLPSGLVIGSLADNFSEEHCFKRIKYVKRY